PTTEAGHYQHNSDKKNKQLGGNELWYYLKNIHGQCPTCNRWKSGNLSVYSLFMEEKYGHGILQEIRTLYHTPKKWTIQELLEVEALYKQKLAEL
ncbi:MAG: recombination protein NinG, partial [Minisyncoccota bacterium]